MVLHPKKKLFNKLVKEAKKFWSKRIKKSFRKNTDTVLTTVISMKGGK